MTFVALLVVCQIVAGYRPEVPQTLEVAPCRTVDLQGLCNTKLEANECLHVVPASVTPPPNSPKRPPKLRWRNGRAAAKELAACELQGPWEGFAVLYGGTGEVDTAQKDLETVTVDGKAPWRLSGQLHFHRLRFEVPGLRVSNASLTFYNTSSTNDGGAISAGRGGLKLRQSTVQIFSSMAKRGGAIAVSSRSQLSCEDSTIVTERTNGTIDGGSIYARNVRLENSTLQMSFTWATDGGAMMADMLVARSNSRILISHAHAYGHGGATYSHKRLVLMDSLFRATHCDASQTLASKGGAIYAFLLEMRNSSVDIDDAASGEDGSCIHAVRSMTVRGSSLKLTRCMAQSRGALHVGGDLQLLDSSLTSHNCSAQSGGALHTEKVLLNSSTMTFTKIRSQVPPVAMEVAVFKMTGGSSLSLQGTGDHDGFSAIELKPPVNDHEPQSFVMSADSRLLISDFFSGILTDGGILRLRGAQLRGLSFAVEMPRGDTLDVADSVLEDISELAFSCGHCDVLSMRRIRGRGLSALLRAAELKQWSLEDVQARCSRSKVACVQLASAMVFLDPKPWRLENVSLEAENVSSDFAPVLLDVEGPKVQGSRSKVDATCPAGSFSFIQESGSIVSKTAEVLAMFDMMRGVRDALPGTRCCASTKTLPRNNRFWNRTFDFDFGLIPDMNVSCDPATYPCVCTTKICDRQILKTSAVSTRVSCMWCPMGQYSLTPYTQALKGDESGLLSSSKLSHSCTACTDVAKQVGQMPSCAGRSVQVPRGIMSLPGGAEMGGVLQFFRCPNAAACPGGDMVVAENTTLRRCAVGYEETSAGCTVCARGYGRQNLDPFECVRCGRWDLSFCYFLVVPVVPLLLAVRSASQTEKERMSMVIKVILSFGTFLATIENILEQTETYRHLQKRLKVAMGLLDAESAGASGPLLSGSFDCLVANSASRWHYLTFQSFHFVVFLLIFLLFELVTFSRGDVPAFGASWVRRNIVLGNAFLPAIFSSFLQWAPCFHMSKRPDRSFDSFSVFQVTEACGGSLGMPCLGVLLFCALGPVQWAYMVSQSRKWKNRKEYIGFLVAGYTPSCEWWEITVLLRKSLLIGALVLLPVSYAPMSLVIATAVIMLAALVGHLVMRPYVDPLMNLLEGGVLTYSMLALILTLYLMSESWTNTNKTLVFFLLVGSNAVTCLLLLVVFLVIALRRPRQEGSQGSQGAASAPAG